MDVCFHLQASGHFGDRNAIIVALHEDVMYAFMLTDTLLKACDDTVFDKKAADPFYTLSTTGSEMFAVKYKGVLRRGVPMDELSGVLQEFYKRTEPNNCRFGVVELRPFVENTMQKYYVVLSIAVYRGNTHSMLNLFDKVEYTATSGNTKRASGTFIYGLLKYSSTKGEWQLGLMLFSNGVCEAGRPVQNFHKHDHNGDRSQHPFGVQHLKNYTEEMQNTTPFEDYGTAIATLGNTSSWSFKHTVSDTLQVDELLKQRANADRLDLTKSDTTSPKSKEKQMASGRRKAASKSTQSTPTNNEQRQQTTSNTRRARTRISTDAEKQKGSADKKKQSNTTAAEQQRGSSAETRQQTAEAKLRSYLQTNAKTIQSMSLQKLYNEAGVVKEDVASSLVETLSTFGLAKGGYSSNLVVQVAAQAKQAKVQSTAKQEQKMSNINKEDITKSSSQRSKRSRNESEDTTPNKQQKVSAGKIICNAHGVSLICNVE